MAITAATVTIDDARAYVVVAALNANAKAYAYQSPTSFRSVLVTNLSNKTVWLGDSAVSSAATGYSLPAGGSATFTLAPYVALYGKSSQFSATLTYAATS